MSDEENQSLEPESEPETEPEPDVEDQGEDEIEEAARSGGAILGFVLIPLMIVMVCVGIVWVFYQLSYDRRTIQEYSTQIRSANKSERWQAVLDLLDTSRGTTDLVPILVEMLDTPPEDQSLRTSNWTSLDMLKRPEEKNVNLRWYAAAALGKLGGERAEEKLRELITDVDPGVRFYAVHSMARLGNSDFVPAIIERLSEDEDEGVRTVAAFALGEMADPRAIDSLKEAFASEEAGDVVWNSAVALARFGDESVRPALDAMSGSRNTSIRIQARKALTVLDQYKAKRP